MSLKAKIVQRYQQDYVETEDALFGLGLQLPPQRVLNLPTVASQTPLLSLDEIKRIVESEEFRFGSEMFDSSWITNQNGYGSCAAYAGTSVLAKARVLGGQARVDLSGDYTYSKVNGGRDRGSILADVYKSLIYNGTVSASTVPLGGIYPRKYDSNVTNAERLRFMAHEGLACPDEQSMATALVMKKCVAMAIHVTRRWREFDTDDVLAPCNGMGNHSEHLDDIQYDNKRGCLLYRKGTSHTTNYSPGGASKGSGPGYCWTTWEDHYKTTSKYHVFYTLPSAKEDPKGNNPDFFGDQEELTPSPSIKLVMQSSPGCGWCTKWKDNVLPQLQSDNILVEDGIVAGSGVPRFELFVNGQSKIQIGYWDYYDILSKIKELQ